MKNKGFIQLSLLGWVSVAFGAIILAQSIALKVQTSRLDSAKSRIEEYRVAGELAKKESDRKDKENRLRKEKSDEAYKRTITRLNSDITRLRGSASESSLPRPSPSTSSPERITFDRGELDAAITQFTVEVSDIVGEGAKAVEALDEAKRWAR